MSTIINKVKDAIHPERKHDSTITTGTQHGTAEGVHGPHESRIANAADPRVDSDLDGSRTVGTTGTMGNGGHHHNTAGGFTGNGAYATGENYSHTTGAGVGTMGHGFTTGGTGPGPAPNTAGPHRSDVLNKMDPRVDSDMDGSRKIGQPGPGPNTAGPHTSDMVNKLDPRVDSDMDGSRTFGGNQTYRS